MSETPYVQIWGLDFSTAIEFETPPASTGGGRKTDEYSLPDWKRAQILDAGRDSTRYSGEVASGLLQDIKDILAEFNSAPPDVEFYPMDSDLCVYAALASARFTHPEVYQSGTKNWYNGSFEVTSREPFAFGPRQGLTYAEDVSLPSTSALLTNLGTEINGIDYLCLSGYYDALLGYSKDLKLTINDYDLPLCAQLMGHDQFELSRWGEVEHSYRLDFARPYASLQSDLWGPTFCYGGAMDADSLTLAGQIMFPFTGPLPVSESPPPCLDFHVESGNFAVWKAYTGGLSDIELVDATVRKGHNVIDIPDCDGVDFVAFGLVGIGVITDLTATVKRYQAESELPEIDVNDEFTIAVSDGDHSNHMLASLQAVYRNKSWF